MAAADILFEVMSMMVKKGPLSKMVDGLEDGEL
jgi:agmatinase